VKIQDAIAVVTGAASGIGKAVSIELSKRGAKVLALIDACESVHQLADSVNNYTNGSAEARPYVGDVTDETFRRWVFDEIASEWGAPRICVPAAGISRDSLAAKVDKESGKAVLYSIDDFRRTLEVNLVAPAYWALEMVGRVAEQRHAAGLGKWGPNEHIQGTVIFIGSVSSQGNKGQIAYAATKAGLEGAAATLMKEAMFHGVRCGVIHPGYTDTPMVHALSDEFIEKKILPYTQLRRLIRPEEIADAICFMIANSAVSGQLWADAGWQPSA
jgi:3-oxoacyl-[acyl-carrier protein] reductase